MNAMKKKFSVVLVSCCLSLVLGASTATAGPKGQCNRILAGMLADAAKIESGSGQGSCLDLVAGLREIATGNGGICLDLFLDDELFIEADDDNPLVRDFCETLVDPCNVNPILLDLANLCQF